jgi:hypothetical protein
MWCVAQRYGDLVIHELDAQQDLHESCRWHWGTIAESKMKH